MEEGEEININSPIVDNDDEGDRLNKSQEESRKPEEQEEYIDCIIFIKIYFFYHDLQSLYNNLLIIIRCGKRDKKC